MAYAHVFTLLVITFIQLCRTEISTTLPESWFSANVINDGRYSPKPIQDLFTSNPNFSSDTVSSEPPPFASQKTFSPTSPIVVLPTESTRNTFANTMSTKDTTLSTPSSSTFLNPMSSSIMTSTPYTNLMPSSQPSTYSTAIPQANSGPNDFQTPFNFFPPNQSGSAPFPFLPQLPPFPFQQDPNVQPPNMFNIPQNIPTLSPALTTITSTSQSTTSMPFVSTSSTGSTGYSTIPTLSAYGLTTPTTISVTPRQMNGNTTRRFIVNGTNPIRVPGQFPPITIKMVAPKGSVTNVKIQTGSTSTTTRRPTPKRRRRNYDNCVNSCGEKRARICATPIGVPINPDKLKGFPSVCHMACHNSFRKEVYEKITDGRCSKLRTRIRPIDSNRLKKDDLRKTQYTIIQKGNAQQTIVEFTPLRNRRSSNSMQKTAL